MRDEALRPDYSARCLVCGASPVVPATGMCGPCTFGEAETAGGAWWPAAHEPMSVGQALHRLQEALPKGVFFELGPAGAPKSGGAGAAARPKASADSAPGEAGGEAGGETAAPSGRQSEPRWSLVVRCGGPSGASYSDAAQDEDLGRLVEEALARFERWQARPAPPARTRRGRRDEGFGFAYALGRLHRELPRDVGFTVHRLEWGHCEVEWRDGRAVRRDPPAYGRQEQWSVTVLCPPATPATYLEVTLEASLEAATSAALQKFREWDAAGRPPRTAAPAQPAPEAKPPPLSAPGSAEGAGEPDARQRQREVS